jgi:L-amino acid N-acyltransferase YncA
LSSGVQIYEAGIATGKAAFEPVAPSWEAWDASHLADHRLVPVDGDTVVGWPALGPVSERCVDAGVAQNSVYIAPDARGCGADSATSCSVAF